MAGALSLAEMRSNVALSRSHVGKQEIIIARLSDQGHVALAADARALLVTMHAHLATEIEMLIRMEAALQAG